MAVTRDLTALWRDACSREDPHERSYLTNAEVLQLLDEHAALTGKVKRARALCAEAPASRPFMDDTTAARWRALDEVAAILDENSGA